MKAKNLKSVSAAFAIAQIDGTWAACNSQQTIHPNITLTWGGDINSPFSAQVAAVQAAGLQVIASFGGYGDQKVFPQGREIAGLITNVTKLTQTYADFINKYGIKSVDFDIEEGGNIQDMPTTVRRNTAIKNLMGLIPGLTVSYTVAVDIRGLNVNGLNMLKDAASQGVKPRSVNIMVMDFGASGKDATKSMSENAITAAKAAYAQIQSIWSSSTPFLGLIPMIGQNDISDEVFTLKDAANLKAFAESTPYVGFMSFWSLDRDAPGVKLSGKSADGQCAASYASGTDTGTPESGFTDALRPCAGN
jgi:hypothetical protein